MTDPISQVAPTDSQTWGQPGLGDLITEIQRAVAEGELVMAPTDSQRIAELERRLEAMIAATFIADEEDHTDWQRGYRACSERVRFAFEAPLPPRILLKEQK